ncbi:MAG: MmgE/PrpD family protein [Chloroflexi bacterium]|nr:MmgE/PrpD family protein [Chloroflexota bacterium]
MSLTATIARFAVETPLDDIPAEARRWGTIGLLDTLGVALAGARTEVGEVITRYVARQGGTPEAGVLGCDLRLSAALAALANGTLAHALDYDDINRSMYGHPSAPLLPVVLALGERERASGAECLAAYLVGFEVECKLRAALGPDYSDDLGWHPTAPLATVGAAAAAVRLLRLDAPRAQMAVSLAASQAAGLRANFGTMTKPFHAGNAARAAIVAADLVALGFTAATDALEARYGFCQAYSGGKPDPQAVVGRLGQPWDILQPGLVVKAYPCCGSTHRALDGVLALIRQHDIRPDDVVEVDCQVSFDPPRSLIHDDPHSGLEGKFSMQYCLAAALVDRAIRLDTFDDAMVRRPAVRALLPRVRMRRIPGDEGQPTWVRPEEHVVIHLRDGRQLRTTIVYPKGEATVPLSQEELRDKFRDCAARVLSAADVERAIELVEGLETLPDVRALTSAVCRAPVAAPAGR